jgi:hypothetical protein
VLFCWSRCRFWIPPPITTITTTTTIAHTLYFHTSLFNATPTLNNLEAWYSFLVRTPICTAHSSKRDDWKLKSRKLRNIKYLRWFNFSLLFCWDFSLCWTRRYILYQRFSPCRNNLVPSSSREKQPQKNNPYQIIFFYYLNIENEGSRIFRKVGNNSPKDAAPYARKKGNPQNFFGWTGDIFFLSVFCT